jgi:hypothetical protein
MATATVHLTLCETTGAVDLYLSLEAPGLGPVARDLRSGPFTVGLTADGRARTLRILDLGERGGVFARAAGAFKRTRKPPAVLGDKLLAACAEQIEALLRRRAHKDHELLASAKTAVEVEVCPA